MDRYRRLARFFRPNPARDQHQHYRQILLVVLYFMVVGVVIELWALSMAIKSTVLTSICVVLTFVLFVILVNRLYYMQNTQQPPQQREPVLETDEEDFPYVLASLGSGIVVIRRMDENLTDEQLESALNTLRCFSFDAVKQSSSVVSVSMVAITTGEEGVGSSDGPLDADYSTDASAVKMVETQTEGGGEAMMCSICLVDYKHRDTLVALSCKHVYHRGCLKEWLRRKNSCPLCKDQVAVYNNHRNDG